MIYTYQIIDGFESLLGPETIHIPIFLSLVFFIGTPEGETDERDRSNNLFWQSAIFHFTCAFYHLLTRLRTCNYCFQYLSQIFAIFLIIGQAHLMITATILVIHSIAEEKSEHFTADQKKWQFWALLELLSIAAITISGILFNLIRYLAPTRIYIYYLQIALPMATTSEQCSMLWRPHKIPFPENLKQDQDSCEKKQASENTDFMFAHKSMLRYWVTFITPAVISIGM